MKKNGQQGAFYAALQMNKVNARPTAPVASRETVSERRASDPSSVVRSDRYPIPNSFEYRMRP